MNIELLSLVYNNIINKRPTGVSPDMVLKIIDQFETENKDKEDLTTKEMIIVIKKFYEM